MGISQRAGASIRQITGNNEEEEEDWKSFILFFACAVIENHYYHRNGELEQKALSTGLWGQLFGSGQQSARKHCNRLICWRDEFGERKNEEKSVNSHIDGQTPTTTVMMMKNTSMIDDHHRVVSSMCESAICCPNI